ncbi:MAG: hypothetical protein IID45_02010, partial [Planctomycetes bacterium]|nr:hypothetical protein [Planctomycetota bacterium]
MPSRRRRFLPTGRVSRFVGGMSILVLFASLLIVAVVYSVRESGSRASRTPDRPIVVKTDPQTAQPRSLNVKGQNLTIWWDAVPDAIRENSHPRSQHSNIHLPDYAGPQRCARCHKENYDDWSKHPHRWMNALANEKTVKGDFSGNATILHLGVRGKFYRKGSEFRMLLTRKGRRREYTITQTIGSRFYQYYVGKQISGPEPPDHRFYKIDHVLQFGYWLDRKEWVPVVHVSHRYAGEPSDDKRVNEFDRPDFIAYTECITCHDTFPLADAFCRSHNLKGRHAPRPLHWSMSEYVAEAHPELLTPNKRSTDYSDEELNRISRAIKGFEGPRHAVTLGISCEACHLGAKRHAEKKEKRPSFFPQSPYLFVPIKDG